MEELTAHTDTHLKVKGRASDRSLTPSRPAVMGFAAALVTAAVVPSAIAAGVAGAASVSRSGTLQATAAAGTLRSWGNNNFGQLGDGSATRHTTPVKVKLPRGTKVTSVRAGCGHSLALTTTGTVLAWGYNHFGQLGNGTTTDSHTPVRVKLPKGVEVAAIRAGCTHNLALTTTGSVLAWGDNTGGALGDGTTTSRSKPVKVKFATGIKIKAISAGGDDFSLALTTTGKVLAWGNNPFGQLGDGTTTSRSKPGKVKFPSGTVVKTIAGGGDHALAVTARGKLLAWGGNFVGQLGDGTTTNSDVPKRIVVLLAGRPVGRITALFAGCDYTLLLTTRRSMLAWGYNGDGELGDGTSTSSDTAVRVGLPVGVTVKTVSAGCSDTFALTTSGHVLAWGYNVDGQLGDGTAVGQSDNPVTVKLSPGLFAIAIGAGPGAESSLAIVRPR